MTNLSPALIERFIGDLDREIAEHRAHVRARKNVRRFLRKLLRSTSRGETTSTAPAEKLINPEPPQAKRVEQASTEPMGAGGAHDGLPVRPATNPADTSGTMSDVSAAMNTLLGDNPPPVDEQGETRKGEQGESPGETARSGEDRHGPQVLSNKSHATDKSGEASSEASPVPSLRASIEALHKAHPEYTANQAIEALNCKRSSLTAYSAILGIKWAPSRGEKKPVQPVSAPDEPSPAPTPERPPASAVEPAIAFVPPRGEKAERRRKRIEVAELHLREPWLTPDAAAARLAIPVGNLRIFSQELDIAWSRPRPESEPSKLVLDAAPKTLREKVRAMHAMHPTWTPRILAQHLGANVDSVSTYLSEARKLAAVTKDQPVPINREVA